MYCTYCTVWVGRCCLSYKIPLMVPSPLYMVLYIDYVVSLLYDTIYGYKRTPPPPHKCYIGLSG